MTDAASLPFGDRSFDVVFSWSVFFYFDSLEYAGKVLDEMRRVTRHGGKIFVGDVNDLAKEPLARRLREETGDARRKRRVSETAADHLYYPRDFFTAYAAEHGTTATFYEEDVEELAFYENARYRYSLLIMKI